METLTEAAAREIREWRGRAAPLYDTAPVRAYAELRALIEDAALLMDRLLADLRAAHGDEVTRLMVALEMAWGIIANAGGGDWSRDSREWQEAAARWRDEHWHPALSRNGNRPRSDDTPPTGDVVSPSGEIEP